MTYMWLTYCIYIFKIEVYLIYIFRKFIKFVLNWSMLNVYEFNFKDNNILLVFFFVLSGI